jgi:hypothetical protein
MKHVTPKRTPTSVADAIAAARAAGGHFVVPSSELVGTRTELTASEVRRIVAATVEEVLARRPVPTAVHSQTSS